jgi:hypothetical protein
VQDHQELGDRPIRRRQRRAPALQQLRRHVLQAHLPPVTRDPLPRVAVIRQRRRLDRPVVLGRAQPLRHRVGDRHARPGPSPAARSGAPEQAHRQATPAPRACPDPVPNSAFPRTSTAGSAMHRSENKSPAYGALQHFNWSRAAGATAGCANADGRARASASCNQGRDDLLTAPPSSRCSAPADFGGCRAWS